MPPDARWICMHNRVSAYFTKKFGGDWSYHDYRNFDVQRMVSAAEELTRRGYYVVRVGSVQRDRMATDNPMIVDYASSPHRSEFGDIYLNATCAAYIGSDSGIASSQLAFRRPVSYINFSQSIVDVIPKQGCYWLPFIVKHLHHRGLGRRLSLREMFERGLFHAGDSGKFASADVSVVSNTPEEIRDLEIEVAERLFGSWAPAAEDEVLQRRFWEIVREYDPAIDVGSTATARIGAMFLRQHRYLLA